MLLSELIVQLNDRLREYGDGVVKVPVEVPTEHSCAIQDTEVTGVGTMFVPKPKTNEVDFFYLY